MHKKLLSLVMALVLLVSLAVPASAEGSGDAVEFPFSDIGDLGEIRYHAYWVLWNQEGQPEPEGDTDRFEDVPEDSPYHDAVYWCFEQSLCYGVSETQFYGEGSVSRAAAATILCQYAEYLGIDTTPTSEEWPFEEWYPANWYSEPMLWCYENGLLSTIDGELKPHELNQCSHFYTEPVDREPTCTEDGCLDGTACMLCGTLTAWKELYPAMGHDMEILQSIEPQCETSGYLHCRCSRCGEETEETIPALGHDWDNGYVETFPDTYHNGRRIHTCRACAAKGYSEIDYLNNLSFIKFGDIISGDYYYEPVLWAVQFGITTGIDNTHFAPNKTCTRGQVVTFLWRAMGCPAPEEQNPFVDVAADAYYYDAVLWAAENGITTGTDSTHFAPESTATRGQFATFLWRLFGCPEPEGSSPFTDVPPTEYYAKAVCWAAEMGITTGATETTFQPIKSCTRGQVVTFLYRV